MMPIGVKPTEDAKAEADKVAAKQEPKPIQVLRNGAKPSDEARTLQDYAIPAGYENCWIDVYEGPRGSGFVVNYEIVKGDEHYVSSDNFGPETERTVGWTLVVKNDPKGTVDAEHLD